jgi:probable DNA metabolism protein
VIEAHADDFVTWRTAARRLLTAHVRSEDVIWNAASLFSEPEAETEGVAPFVPKEFLQLAETVALHRNPEPWPVLYRVLYRLTHGEPSLLRIAIDDDVRALELMKKAVHRDMHKMTAFVRFRRIAETEPEPPLHGSRSVSEACTGPS